MIFLLIRLAIFLFIVFAIYQLLQYGLGIASTHRNCLRCEGMGYWEGLRGREKCKDCEGSGRTPKQLKR